MGFAEKLSTRLAKKKDPESVASRYDELLSSLFHTLLLDETMAERNKRVLKKYLDRTHRSQAFKEHERAWVLHSAYQVLLDHSKDISAKAASTEQLQLDSSLSPKARLDRFGLYFHRLSLKEQFLLLLHDKFSISYGELSSAMSTPEESLKVIRQQALRSLEEWIWEND